MQARNQHRLVVDDRTCLGLELDYLSPSRRQSDTVNMPPIGIVAVADQIYQFLALLHWHAVEA
ncbi:MAG: hypothetical protein M3451_13715, partial [Chloroflexota bacterium]|nr:hypothetical protein [Chloroflexota bacterium]